MQTQFIVFTGPSQCGKSTAAAYLVAALRARGTAMHCSFELPGKQYLAALIGRKFDMDEPMPELLAKTPREFLRLEAQHLRFNYGPNAVGSMLLSRVARWTIPPMWAVVDNGVSVLDCRVLGDYYLVQLTRTSVERVYPFVIPNADVYVRNNGTLDDLQMRMRELAIKMEKMSHAK